jgi:hypothetical protein
MLKASYCKCHSEMEKKAHSGGILTQVSGRTYNRPSRFLLADGPRYLLIPWRHLGTGVATPPRTIKALCDDTLTASRRVQPIMACLYHTDAGIPASLTPHGTGLYLTTTL